MSIALHVSKQSFTYKVPSLTEGMTPYQRYLPASFSRRDHKDILGGRHHISCVRACTVLRVDPATVI